VTIIDEGLGWLKKQFALEDDPNRSEEVRVRRLITLTAGVCAVVAMQPLPFADTLVLTPIQGFMCWKIGEVMGFPMKEKDGGTLLREIAGLIGMGLLAQNLAIGLYKTGLPFLGGFFTFPIVFGLTYAIGEVAVYYFTCKRSGQVPTAAKARELFMRSRKQGEHVGKEEREAWKKRVQDGDGPVKGGEAR